MVRIIKIHEIDEFSEIMTIPAAAINDTILSNIRELNEKTEMEPFIREILSDPNETPHGPTEIADILTSHVHVRGDKRLAAFILKGKSFDKVTSRHVTHQFAKLRQIPQIGLMVFGAVGNIQDDAQKDFVQTAKDAGCDYLIIDAQDCARLFIAYKKICPKDGKPYDNTTGTCPCGHVRDRCTTIEVEVGERPEYKIIKKTDLSKARAKRYSAKILVDRHYSKDVIRTIIQKATEELKDSNYHRSEELKEKWGGIPAHVVWLYIACDLNDLQIPNWICRSCWIDRSLPENMRPHGLNGNEKVGDIEVLWNDDYKSDNKFFKSHFGTKEEVLENIRPILNEMMKLAKQAIAYFEEYRGRNISEEEFISKMQKMEPRVTELYLKSGNIPMPPEDCKDYYQACQNIFATIHNMFIYYSERGLETWPKRNRDLLMQDDKKRFHEGIERIYIEESKIH
nr:hypothetical protein BSM_21060 [uncultured archaeon]